jgi:hypothetical protein
MAHEYKNIKRLHAIVCRAIFRTDSSLGYSRTLEALERLAKEVKNTDTDETVWYIGESTEATLDSVIIGAYWFCANYHGGQWSPEYRLLSILGGIYEPGQCCNGPEPDSGESMVYEQLEALQKAG